jgi:predicted ATPase/DNA-binding SARP family transcriptional activator
LGAVSLAVGERVIGDEEWPPRGGRALLLLLLATPGHLLPRDRVFDALWPSLTPDAARNACYKALHSLRRVLEPRLPARDPGAFVAVSGDSIGLVPAACDVDVDAFESALAGMAGEEPQRRRRSLQEALALYRGDLLADELDAGWATERRERLHRLWQGALLEVAGLEIEEGESERAIPRLAAFLAADATNEAAHRLLIRAYDAAGQRDLASRQYAHCVAVLRDELGVDPSRETQRVAAAVLDPVVSAAARSGQPRSWHNLPAPPSRLIGRETELEEIVALLGQPHARLLTLIGPGGVGKTRLALAVASELANELADGVCFVSLAAVRELELVIPAIARALGIREEPDSTPLAQLRAVLADRHLLLVLDNFEQVCSAAPQIAELLASCPELRILVTSREPLKVRAERLIEIPPLDVPEHLGENGRLPPLAVLERSAAVELFVERATAVAPRFSLNERNAVAVARICARLDGLPLAIELAAARSRELAPDQLLTLLDRRLSVLVDGYQDLPARQRTMRDAIAWSHDLLAPELHVLFRRLAVFAGGCTVEAAMRLDGSNVEMAEARLRELVTRSLLRWQPDTDPVRAGMLETTREFACDRLAAAGETALASDVLTACCVDLTTAARDHLSGPQQGAWLDRLDAEHDNLRAALTWTIQRGEADRALLLCANLWRHWWSRGYLTEGREWMERALALPGRADPEMRGAAINGAASLAESQGDFARATALHEEALALWRRLGSLAGEARALSGLGTAAAHRGDYAAARDFHERALTLVQQAGDRPGMARTLDRLGTVAFHQGDFARAEACYAQSLDIFRGGGDMVNASIVLSHLGEVCHQQGQIERAAELFEEALRLERELDLPDGVATELTLLAGVRLGLGEVERAAALSAQGVRLFRDMGNQVGLAGALAVFAAVTRARGDAERARDLLRESLSILAAHDERSAIPEQFEQLAAVLLDLSQPRRAALLLGAAAALRERIKSPLTPLDRKVADQAAAAARAALGECAFSHALADGRALPLDRALAEAIADATRDEADPVMRPSRGRAP